MIALPRFLVNAVGALVLATGAYLCVRWRASSAVASSRLIRHATQWLPRGPRSDFWVSPRPWRYLVWVVALCLGTAAAGLCWLSLGEVLGSGRSDPIVLQTAPGRDPAGGLLLLAFSLLFVAYGLHHVLFRRRWARWNQWLHRVDLPVGASPSEPPRDGGTPNTGWQVAMVLVGVWWVLVGLVALWFAVGLIASPPT
jgi:hypothetical protein